MCVKHSLFFVIVMYSIYLLCVVMNNHLTWYSFRKLISRPSQETASRRSQLQRTQKELLTVSGKFPCRRQLLRKTVVEPVIFEELSGKFLCRRHSSKGRPFYIAGPWYNLIVRGVRVRHVLSDTAE